MRHHFRDIFECYIDILFYDSVASEDIGLLIDVVYKWVVAKTKWPNGKLFRFQVGNLLILYLGNLVFINL